MILLMRSRATAIPAAPMLAIGPNPPSVTPGKFTYKATAMLFSKDSETEIKPGPTAELEIEPWDEGYASFELSFTRLEP
jgi:hypothetical protein